MASVLFMLEKARTPEAKDRVVDLLKQQLRDVADSSLKSTFTRFLNAQLAQILNKKPTTITIEFVTDSFWEDAMYSNSFQRLYYEATEKGIAEGKATGIAEGEARGIAQAQEAARLEKVQLCLEFLQDRFGELDRFTQRRVESADSAQLKLWMQRVYKMEDIGQVFGDDGGAVS